MHFIKKIAIVYFLITINLEITFDHGYQNYLQDNPVNVTLNLHCKLCYMAKHSI